MGGRNPAPPTVYICIHSVESGCPSDRMTRRSRKWERRSQTQPGTMSPGSSRTNSWRCLGAWLWCWHHHGWSRVFSNITIVIVNTWVPSKTQICVFAGFWDVAVPTTILVFVSRSCPAPNCGCWSACFFNVDWPCAVNNTRNLIISFFFLTSRVDR